MKEYKLVLNGFVGVCNSPAISRFTSRDAEKLGKRYKLNCPVCMLYGFDGGAAVLGFDSREQMYSFTRMALRNSHIDGRHLPYMLIGEQEHKMLRA